MPCDTWSHDSYYYALDKSNNIFLDIRKYNPDFQIIIKCLKIVYITKRLMLYMCTMVGAVYKFFIKYELGISKGGVLWHQIKNVPVSLLKQYQRDTVITVIIYMQVHTDKMVGSLKIPAKLLNAYLTLVQHNIFPFFSKNERIFRPFWEKKWGNVGSHDFSQCMIKI